MRFQGRFIVAVPAHAFAAVVVEVEQAGIESGTAMLLCEPFDFQQAFCPGQGKAAVTGISVIEGPVAVPGYFSTGDDVASVDFYGIAAPGNLLKKCFEQFVCFGR